eukprot:695217_1
MDEHNSLIGERISNRIENELEAAYGDDIDVIVKRPDDANDTEQTKENDFLGVNVIVLVVIGIAILILIVAILYCFLVGRSRHKHAQDTQSMVQKELEQDTTVANKGSESSDQVRSMINGLRKAPTDLLVTKRDLETSGVNDKVLDEIEGKEERYTHEGGTDTDEKKKEKTTMGSNETNTGIVTKQIQGD